MTNINNSTVIVLSTINDNGDIVLQSKKWDEELCSFNDMWKYEEEAKQRILFDRATMQPTPAQDSDILYQGQVVVCPALQVEPLSLAPGVVPLRLVGRKPIWPGHASGRCLGSDKGFRGQD